MKTENESPEEIREREKKELRDEVASYAAYYSSKPKHETELPHSRTLDSKPQ